MNLIAITCKRIVFDGKDFLYYKLSLAYQYSVVTWDGIQTIQSQSQLRHLDFSPVNWFLSGPLQ